jgi:hypothetical protein
MIYCHRKKAAVKNNSIEDKKSWYKHNKGENVTHLIKLININRREKIFLLKWFNFYNFVYLHDEKYKDLWNGKVEQSSAFT